nr:RNA-directed DNA polymerase, eukaryota, reverse transcriptase zinc-binding domain protein [Tanacetum cinerariifolium]
MNGSLQDVQIVKYLKKGKIRRGADMDTLTKVGTNIINKLNGYVTSNSFDALNTLDVEDKCGTSSSRGDTEEDQEARPKVSQLNEHYESDDKVDKHYRAISHFRSFSCEVVESGWNVNIEGFAMYRVVKRLKGLKSPFCKLLHDHGNLHEWVNRIRVELDEA